MPHTPSAVLGQPIAQVMDYLTHLLVEQGHWLVDEQPSRAAADFDTIAERFHAYSGHVGEALRHAITTRWPTVHWSELELSSGARLAPEHAEAYWVCDPLDGALHYLSGLPGWAISLTLVLQGKPALALVHDPASGRTYRAVAGGGADCDGVPLRVGERGRLEEALVATAHPNWPGQVREDTADFLARFNRLLPRVFGLRQYGPISLLMAQVAGGAFDGYWECGSDMHDWMPGLLLAEEAGGTARALDGRSLDWGCHGIVVAGPAMHGPLSAALAGGAV